MTHQRVDAGQRIAVDGPKVKPSAGTSGDVAHQVVNVEFVDGRKRRIVPRQLADESQPRQIPDDGRSILHPDTRM